MTKQNTIIQTKPTNSAIEEGKQLPLMEMFYTLQGEGWYQGEAAYFIRLAGCDVGCHWCDVKESWPEEAHPMVAVDKIIEAVKKTPANMVVVTGGEPLMHNLDYLCQQLKQAGLRRHIETSGAWPLSGQWEMICLSPKKYKQPLPEVIKAANELKVVVYNHDDFTWAAEHARIVPADCKLFLQPEWSRYKQMLPKIIEYIKQNPQWLLSVQLHKYIDVP